MKFPNHIFLDINNTSTNNTSRYWVTCFLFNIQKLPIVSTTLYFNKITDVTANNYSFIKNQKQFTINYSHAFKNLNDNNTYLSIFLNFTNFLIKHSNNALLKKNQFSFLNNLFDINFLRKEKIYTKLKYSRVPQYDIVSGGVAAIFSGFLGFLICEKFGLELLDSGDFYFFFMYMVFILFFLRMFLRISLSTDTWFPTSHKWFFFFITNYFFIALIVLNLYLIKFLDKYYFI